MSLSPAAQQLFDELVQRFPVIMSPKAAAVEGNEGLTSVHGAVKSGELDSFVAPDTRKRNIFGRSVALRIARKYDAALAAGASPKFTEKATTASLTSRRLNPPKRRQRRLEKAREMAEARRRSTAEAR
jgi:hypothetical protein